MQHLPNTGDLREIPICKLSIRELLLHALVIEREAKHRYEELANMMENIGNRKVSRLFAKMAEIEATHAESIDRQIRGRELPVLTPS
ncbi:MAG: hypothetical protein OEY72_01880 [Gammaproteobacteria bacterium]|nr:hypothetical protein [Gammaproteobacteria bacterium]